MKKTFLLLIPLFLSNLFNAQEFSDELLLKNRSSEVVDMSKTFVSIGNVTVENFDGSKINVQYDLFMDFSKYESIKDKTIFNKIAKHAINDASYRLKNKYTFKPRKINFFLQDNNTFRVGLEYTAENDYGAIKTGNTNNSDYDFSGNFIKQ